MLIFNSQLFSAKTCNGLITHMNPFCPVCMCKTSCVNPKSSDVSGLNACYVFRRVEEVIRRVCPCPYTPRAVGLCVFAYVKIAERLHVQISGDRQKSMQMVTFNTTHDPYCSVLSLIHTHMHIVAGEHAAKQNRTVLICKIYIHININCIFVYI